MAADDVIRASDSDRDNVVAVLQDAYAAGRLTLTEFEERASAAFAGRTWGELRKLTGDLPDQPRLGPQLPAALAGAAADAGSPGPAAQDGRAWDRSPGPAGAARLIPALPIAFVWLAISLFAHSSGAFVPIGILLLIGLKFATGSGHHG